MDTAIWSEIWQGQIGLSTPVGGVVTVLSAGGKFVEVSEGFTLGSHVGIRFTLPGTKEEIVCGGIVRDNVPGRGIGVEFTQLANIDRERLRAAAWSLAQPGYEPPPGIACTWPSMTPYMPFTEMPRFVMITTATNEMKLASRPYSMRSCPRSSWTRTQRSLRISLSFRSQ